MIVIVANDLPPAMRGKLKLWFVEPKPNVFVSGVKESLADHIVEMLLEKCPIDSGLLIFKRDAKPPYFQIYSKGMPAKTITNIFGLQLICEKSIPVDDQ
jgi:CRISPR-associated protein Cas2